MNKRKIIVNGSENEYSRWQEYRQVWINKWNLICVKVVAIISFIVIITVIVVKSIPDSNSDSDPTPKHRNYLFRMGKATPEIGCTYSMCSYWGKERCCFHCFQIDADEVPDMISVSFNDNKCTEGIMLTLEEVNFESGIMKKNWWSNKIYVAHIFITQCYLLDIEDGTFNSKYFSSTITTTFIKSQIPYYRKNMFTGMRNLIDFEIRDSDQANVPNPFEDPDSEGIKFEFGVLENFKNSLTTLQVQNSIIKSEAIRNLTGIELNALQIIDFRFNKNPYIPDGAFKTKSLLSLYMSYSGLREIHDNAFINAPRVAKIYLQNNKLKTINEKTFRSFTAHNEITISNNDWVCSCNLKSITMYEKNDIDMTTCNDNIPLRQLLNNCEASTTESTFTPSENSSSEPTTSSKISSSESTSSSENSSSGSTSSPSDNSSSEPTTSSKNPSSEPTSSSTLLQSTPSENSSSRATSSPTENSSSESTTSSDISSSEPTSSSKNSNSQSTSSSENSSSGTSSSPSENSSSKSTSSPLENTSSESTSSEKSSSKFTSSSSEISSSASSSTENTIPSSGNSEDYQPPKTTKIIINPIESERSCRVFSKQFKIDSYGPQDIFITYNGTLSSGDHFTLLTANELTCKLINEQKGHISKSNTPYIMCKHNENELDCIAGRSPATYDEETWLHNSARTPVILIGSAVTVLASILSGISVFYCVRKHPKLLRGNKKLAFVRGPGTDMVVIPSKPHTPVYLSPVPPDYGRQVSYIPVRDAAYLTPISQRYMQVEERYERPGLKRSLSDQSMKTVASYVTENQLMSSKRYSRPERVSAARNFEDPPPPPLPPPRRRYEEVIVHEGDLRNRNSHYW